MKLAGNEMKEITESSKPKQTFLSFTSKTPINKSDKKSNSEPRKNPKTIDIHHKETQSTGKKRKNTSYTPINSALSLSGFHRNSRCYICQKELKTLSVVKATMHINNCLDLQEGTVNNSNHKQITTQYDYTPYTPSKQQFKSEQVDIIKLEDNKPIPNNTEKIYFGVSESSRKVLIPKENVEAVVLSDDTETEFDINTDKLKKFQTQKPILSISSSGNSSIDESDSTSTSLPRKKFRNSKPTNYLQDSFEQDIKPEITEQSTYTDTQIYNSSFSSKEIKIESDIPSKIILSEYSDNTFSEIDTENRIINTQVSNKSVENFSNNTRNQQETTFTDEKNSISHVYLGLKSNINQDIQILHKGSNILNLRNKDKTQEANYNIDFGSNQNNTYNNIPTKRRLGLSSNKMKMEVLQRELNKAFLWYKTCVFLNSSLPEENYGRSKKNTKTKKCPEYKLMPGTSFSVDAFRYGKIPNCTGYFLTHFHSDHYGGLTSKFDSGMIYCSQITGNLIIENLKVNPKYVCKLPLNWPVLIENTIVTLIDANHCPGSAIFLFDTVFSKEDFGRERILHTGDFRASPEHVVLLRKAIHICNRFNKNKSISSEMGSLSNRNNKNSNKHKENILSENGSFVGFYPLDPFDTSSEENTEKELNPDIHGIYNNDLNNELPPTFYNVNKVYLDTTYMNASYAFPAQLEVIDAVATLCKLINSDPRQRLIHVEASKYTSSAKTTVQSIHKSSNQDSHTTSEIGLSFTSSLKKWFKPNISLFSNTKVPSMKKVSPGKKPLFVVGTYLIGKERLFIEIALAIGSKIYVDERKRKTLMLLEDESIIKLLAEKPEHAQVHVVSLMNVKKQLMEDYLDQYSEHFGSLVAFRPTGWTFQSNLGHPTYVANPVVSDPQQANIIGHKLRMDIPAPDECSRISHYMETIIRTGSRFPQLLSYELGSKCVPSLPHVPFTKMSIKPFGNSNRITIFPVPYSEHSSFRELAAFICSISCDEVIPTVNCERADQVHKMSSIIYLWQKAKDFVESVKCDFIKDKNINSKSQLEESDQTQNELFEERKTMETENGSSNVQTNELPESNTDQDSLENLQQKSVLTIPTRCQGLYW
ncbi:hypothetical protein BB559_004776 [Furculomyces boomerangus]|uniref:DNA repair metallo-beta-lactamase domain-containing protein n=1 Tax=Furculomyces boomerangus TaxID=61424 RepID=A0A2T9YCS3_9FUNG|nr:hypothetical protein BB559_004776 [Furculomyces boomerangus]